MDLQKLTTDELSKLIVYISEEIEKRRREEASSSNNVQKTKQSGKLGQNTLKPATLRDQAHSPPAENEELQPAPKRLKGVVYSNRYQTLSDEDDVKNPDDSGAISHETFPTLNSWQQTNPARNRPTTNQSPPKETTVKPPQKKIPSIMLHQKEKWTSISQKLNDKNILFLKAKTLNKGIRIQPSSAE